MEYTFNQEYINQLAEGKAILEHTKLPEDLPLLIEILKAAKICNIEPFGNSKYYYLGFVNSYASTTILLNPDNLPIIPLHDFVSPNKEELATIESIDARLKELEGIVKDNGNQEFIQWLTRTDVANKIVKMFEGEMKKATKEEQPKEVLPQAEEELMVNIRGDQHGNHNFIQVSNGLGGFTKEQAEHYQAIIKNALNGTN